MSKQAASRPIFGDTAFGAFVSPKGTREERAAVRAKFAESIAADRATDDEVRAAYRLTEISAAEIMALLSDTDPRVRRLASGQWVNRFTLEERDAARNA